MKMTEEQVEGYWRKQALENGSSYSASWTDKYAIDIEIRAISEELDGFNILDVGCANGYKTMKLAENSYRLFTGINYVQEMIDQANSTYGEINNNSGSPIVFKKGNILHIDEPDNSFDTVIVSRVLINLSSHEQQCIAIKECIRVLREGGKLIISEATLQGWENINRLRAWFGLSEIPIPEFNTYIDETLIFNNLYDIEHVKTRNISSSYFLGTRILKPLLISFLKHTENASDPLSEINRLFSEFPEIGDYGTQKMFVMKKKWSLHDE